VPAVIVRHSHIQLFANHGHVPANFNVHGHKLARQELPRHMQKPLGLLDFASGARLDEIIAKNLLKKGSVATNSGVLDALFQCADSSDGRKVLRLAYRGCSLNSIFCSATRDYQECATKNCRKRTTATQIIH
jgi:hypothetical protein